MLNFKNLSIQKKLVMISMVTSGIALIFASMAFIGSEYIASRTSTYQNVSSLARVIGSNCVASLTFDDHKAAKETLAALITEPEITRARIYTAKGGIFAQYNQNEEHDEAIEPEYSYFDTSTTYREGFPNVSAEKNYRFHKGILDVFEPIILDGDIIGMVDIRSNLSGLYQRLNTVVVVCFFILSISFLIAYTVSNKAQNTISNPISILIRTMNNVSKNKDYTIRVKRDSQDELGILFDGFNEMLEKIQDREERLHFIQFSMDHLGDSVIWHDPDGNIVDVNNMACVNLGYPREELLAMHLSDIDPGNYPISWREGFNRVRQEKIVIIESKHMKKNGKIFPVEIVSNYLNYKGKEYICSYVSDISERKQLQSKLEQAKKMEAIGTLAGGVAHDLNNILGGLVSYPELLLMDIPDNSPLKKPIHAIRQSGEKAAAIVQDMLTLARRGVNLQTAVNLNDIVNDYLKSPEYKSICRLNPNVAFEIQLENNLPNILGSSFHLFKALMNLISNASESMANGGKVVISTSSRQIPHETETNVTIPDGNYAVLSVKDEGSGISETDRTNIFEPFYTKKIMGKSGTGLGMTVVSGTVEDHRGFIDLFSKENEGSRFDLYFPVTLETLHESKNQLSIDSYRGTERILVIDDVREQRDIASLVLKKLGYHVDTASSGETALEFLSHHQVELIILDMIMEPGLDGLETYKKILEINPRQKAIIASGHAESDRVKETMKLGARIFIKKPYAMEELVMAVRQGLDHTT